MPDFVAICERFSPGCTTCVVSLGGEGKLGGLTLGNGVIGLFPVGVGTGVGVGVGVGGGCVPTGLVGKLVGGKLPVGSKEPAFPGLAGVIPGVPVLPF